MSAEQAHSYQMSGTTCMISHVVQSQHYRDRVYPVTFTTFTVMLFLDASYSCSYSILVLDDCHLNVVRSQVCGFRMTDL